MSSGGSSSSTKVNYPKWLRPHILYGVEQARSLYDRPDTPPSLYAGMDPTRRQFLEGAQAGIVDPAVAEYQKTMSGEYLQGSPYLDEVIRRAQGDAQQNVGSMYGGSGRFGGGQWAASLADAAMGTSAAYRDANWQAERDRMIQAAGGAGGLIDLGQQVGSAFEEDAALRQEEEYRQFQWPYEKLNQMMGVLYGNPSAQRATTTSSGQDTNWLDIVMGILGAAG